MSPTTVALAVAFVWLLGSVAFIARSVRTGRSLADALAARHPDTYEKLGRPRPTYLESVRRNRFARFILRREYKFLDDTVLEPKFEKYRSDELLGLALIGSGAVVTFTVLVWARHAG